MNETLGQALQFLPFPGAWPRLLFPGSALISIAYYKLPVFGGKGVSAMSAESFLLHLNKCLWCEGWKQAEQLPSFPNTKCVIQHYMCTGGGAWHSQHIKMCSASIHRDLGKLEYGANRNLMKLSEKSSNWFYQLLTIYVFHMKNGMVSTWGPEQGPVPETSDQAMHQEKQELCWKPPQGCTDHGYKPGMSCFLWECLSYWTVGE